MKSVTAAECAALAAWRTLEAGDRVGGVIFDDDGMLELRPAHSERAVVRLLAACVDYGARLHATRPAVAQGMPLAVPLTAVLRLARHDHILIVISDFDGIDEHATALIRRFRSHNDVIFVLVHDPMARELPAHGRLIASDGARQLDLDLRKRELHAALSDFTTHRLQRVLDWGHELGVPVLELSAGDDTTAQLRKLSTATVRAVRRP